MTREVEFQLADAITDLHTQLDIARGRAESSNIEFPITGMTVELTVVATTGVDGKAGFKVPVINLELGASGSLSNATTHKIVVQFGQPVGPDDKPIRVERSGDAPLD